MMWS